MENIFKYKDSTLRPNLYNASLCCSELFFSLVKKEVLFRVLTYLHS